MSEPVRVRQSGSRRLADSFEFDPVPCRIRFSMPGKSRLVNPVPGRPNGVSRNTDILVWCECMAQTAEQLRIAHEVIVEGLNPDDVAWPIPKQQRGWDVLGAVSTVLDSQIHSGSSTRGRRSNPAAIDEARKMWEDHRQQRAERIAARQRQEPS